MIDVHCHLTDSRYQDNEISEIVRSGVKIITAGTSLEDSIKAVHLADKYDGVWAVVGIHPENVIDDLRDMIFELNKLTKHPKVVGIGEAGLDYRQDTKTDDKDKQRKLFEAMAELANETKLPIVVHNRNADEDILQILNKYPDLRVLMHCFTRGREFMQKCAERGWYMSFGGLVTYENNPRMKMVVKELPTDLLLLETDAPYSVPAGGMGDINTSANVKIVAEKIAEIRGMTVQDVDELTSANARKLFKLI